MDKAKRKEVEISKDSFSYMHVEGKKHDKNIFFFHATGFNAETYIPFFLKLGELLHGSFILELSYTPDVNQYIQTQNDVQALGFSSQQITNTLPKLIKSDFGCFTISFSKFISS